MAKSEKLRRLENRIAELLGGMQGVGAMAPGTLTRQYRKPAERKVPFYQLSYTHKGKSHTDYVRPSRLAAVRTETGEYRRFRRIIDKIVDLSIQASKIRRKQTGD